MFGRSIGPGLLLVAQLAGLGVSTKLPDAARKSGFRESQSMSAIGISVGMGERPKWERKAAISRSRSKRPLPRRRQGVPAGHVSSLPMPGAILTRFAWAH